LPFAQVWDRYCAKHPASTAASTPAKSKTADVKSTDTGKAKSNLSRTLKTMARYGLVRLERGERGRITPKVTHDRVELDLPLT